MRGGYPAIVHQAAVGWQYVRGRGRRRGLGEEAER